MQSKQKINVDISRDRNLSEPSVYAKQNDSNSRKVEVTLFDSGIQLSSLTAPGKVFFGKADNAYVETIQITNGVTEFIIPQNALSSSGRIQAEILILNDTDTETLTSATFIINCHAQINPSGAITGENNGDILGQILERVEQIQASNMPRTPLPDGAIDLNTLTSSAWWYTAEQRIDITNTPVELAELELIVTRDVISITQILIASDGGVGIYLRFSHDSGRNWTNWQKIATDADISVLNETLRRIDDALDSKVSSVNGKNGTVTVTGADIPLEEGSETLIGPFVRGINNSVLQMKSQIDEIKDETPTNLVNGSADGSLRGIAAKAEDSDYTMGEYAVALGYKTTASGNYSYAEGFFSTASGSYSHAEGNGTASGDCSHSEGGTASGDRSHSEGLSTASGSYSHAEGNGTESSGHSSHAEGQNTVASGYASHAEGQNAVASDSGSHAEGENTIASSSYQHVQGRYNIKDESGKYAHIVGNGSFYYGSAHRSNAHTLDWDGNAWFAGDVYVGGTSQDDESATKLSGVATDVTEVKEKLKNHTAFSVVTTDANSKTYIKLGKFTGDGAGGRAIFTINGKVGWNNKNDGGLKVLTLSSNDSRDTTSTDIFTGGSFFDFGHSDNDGTSIIEDTPDIQVAIVRPSDYTVKEVDIYLKFAQNKYSSYLITVDYSGTCKWETDVKPVNATDPDPMETALSSYIVPKKRFGRVEEGANKTIVDSELSSTSTNPVQNKVVSAKIKNHASFLARRATANTVYINLGKFTGDNGGGKAIITISGNPYWGGKGDGGFRVLTLSSNSYSDISSTDIHTGASLYDFGQSNYTGTEVVDDQYNIQVALVRPNGYSVAEVDVYLKFNNYQYNSYFVTVDYSDGCSWVTSTEKVTTSDPDPMENALSAFIVPKRQIADLTKLKTKADVETGNCTLTVSAGNISNASYSKTGKDVTVNFWFYPDDTNEVVVSGLPYVATKNQSGIASASVGGVRVSYEMSKDNANATLYPETTSEQYCTLTYNLGAYNPQS